METDGSVHGRFRENLLDVVVGVLECGKFIWKMWKVRLEDSALELLMGSAGRMLREPGGTWGAVAERCWRVCWSWYWIRCGIRRRNDV